jgi:hypothetical protein
MTKAEYRAMVAAAIADMAALGDDDEIPESMVELVTTVLFDLHRLAERFTQ